MKSRTVHFFTLTCLMAFSQFSILAMNTPLPKHPAPSWGANISTGLHFDVPDGLKKLSKLELLSRRRKQLKKTYNRYFLHKYYDDITPEDMLALAEMDLYRQSLKTEFEREKTREADGISPAVSTENSDELGENTPPRGMKRVTSIQNIDELYES